MSDSSNNDIALPSSLAPTANDSSTFPSTSTPATAPEVAQTTDDVVQIPAPIESSSGLQAVPPTEPSGIEPDVDASAARDHLADHEGQGVTDDAALVTQEPTSAKTPSPTDHINSASGPPSSSDSLFASASPQPADAEATPNGLTQPADQIATDINVPTTTVPTVSPTAVKDPLPADAEPPQSPQPDHADLAGPVQSGGGDIAPALNQGEQNVSSSGTALQLVTQEPPAADGQSTRQDEGSIQQSSGADDSGFSSTAGPLASSAVDVNLAPAATAVTPSTSALSEQLEAPEAKEDTTSHASAPEPQSEATRLGSPHSEAAPALAAQSDDAKALSSDAPTSLDAPTDAQGSGSSHDSQASTQDSITHDLNAAVDAGPSSTSTAEAKTEQIQAPSISTSGSTGGALHASSSPAKIDLQLPEAEESDRVAGAAPSDTASHSLSATTTTDAPPPRTELADASQEREPDASKSAPASATLSDPALTARGPQGDEREGARSIASEQPAVEPPRSSEPVGTLDLTAKPTPATDNSDQSQGQTAASQSGSDAVPAVASAALGSAPPAENKADSANASIGSNPAKQSPAKQSPELQSASKSAQAQGTATQDERRIALVLSANQELIRLCVELQTKNGVTSSLFRDMSHRLQTNLAFLAGIADSAQRGANANGPQPPTTTPRVDVFPHPSMHTELAALSKDTDLPQLYAGLAKAFEGATRSVNSAPTNAGNAGPTAPVVNGTSAPSPRERKHSRESSSADEPNKRRQGLPNGSSATSARTSSSPAPSSMPFVHPFAGANANHGRPKNGGAGRSASPAGSATSQGPSHESNNVQGQQPQQQQLPGMSAQQSQQLVQMFGPNAILTWRLLQNFLRSPQCTPQFAAMPLPTQMQQIAAMQQHRQRLIAQQQQQQQQNQGMRPGTPNAASSPGSMGPPAPVSVGSPFTPGLDPFGSGGSRSGSVDANGAPNAGSPGSLLRRSVSGDVQMTRNTPPTVPVQVMNPFAATGAGSGSTSSAASTPGVSGMLGGVNGSAAHFANVGSDLGMANGVGQQQQQQAMFPGQQFPQGQNGQGMMPGQQQQQGQQMNGGIPTGGNLQQQLQQLQAMQALRQQQQQQQQQQQAHGLPQQYFPGGGQVNGMPQTPADPNQLPPHLQQLFAHQQMQAASGVNPGMAGGGVVPGNLGGWPATGLNSQSGAGNGQGYGAGGGINPAALFGGPQQQQQQQQQPQQQAHQIPFGGWTGQS